MVGVDDLFWFYQNADTGILLALSIGAYIVWKREIQPRLNALEQTQRKRASKWRDQHLSGQERDLLLDDAHERIDDVEGAVARLRSRLQNLETGIAAETGYRTDVDDQFFRGGDADVDVDFSDQDDGQQSGTSDWNDRRGSTND